MQKTHSFLWLAAVSIALWCPSRLSAQTNEMRAYWVDAFGAGIKTASEVTTLVNNLRGANFNMVLPQVRKRGDAYYNSNFEPKATDISATFDPLQDLITKAHDTSGGKQRLEVHAWIVSFHIWNNKTNPPSQPTHPYNLHPDWLMKNDSGATWDGGNYSFDPGHPEVQKHTYNVAMDLVTNYDIDGINFDYIRYDSKNWGYNSNTVARFNGRFNRTGQPSTTDPTWVQFRRDQVTALVRKVYLNAIAARPEVKVSADTITWAPAVTSAVEWTNSARAYNDVLQDWRGWMEEGILDINIPMNYFRHHEPARATDYYRWSDFIKDHKYNRHAAIGPGIYLNGVSNTIVQMRYTRTPSAAGNYAQGVVGYSYRVTNGTNSSQPTVLSRAAFHAALTNSPNAYDPLSPAVFSQRATIPEMPWKTAPTKGHLKGFIFGGTTNNAYDGATVTLSGPVNRTQVNDATGFYGFVDLPPGTYTVTASSTNFTSKTSSVTITAGVVTTQDLIMGRVEITAHPQSRTNAPGSAATFTVTAFGNSPVYQWRKNGSNLSNGGDISGVNTAALTISNVDGLDSGAYDVIVSNIYNSEISSAATLTVESVKPVIDVQPQSRTNNAGTTASFSVSASGFGTLSYQWRKDGVALGNGGNVSGANTPTLTLSGVLHADAADYTVSVSNLGGSTTSSVARLTVLDPVITTQPVSQSVGTGSNVVFSVAASGTTPLSYQWKKNGLNLTDSSKVAGSATATLSINGLAPSDSGAYTVVVANSVTNVTSSAATLAVFEPPQIVTQPQNQTVSAGANVSFEVSAIGTAPLACQWRLNGLNIPGATGTSYTRLNAQVGHAGAYSVVITNVAGNVVSDDAFLSVTNAVQTMVLSNIWNIRAGSRSYVTTGTTERGLAIHSLSNHVLIVSRATSAGIFAVDADTGANLNISLNTSGVSGGTFVLNKVGVTADGVVYAANLTTSSATTPFKIYRWTDYNSAPVLAYSGTPDGGLTARWGDSFALRGTGTNTQIIISGAGGSAQATNAVIFTTVDGTNFAATVLNPAPAIAPAEFSRGLCFGDGNTFYSKDRATNVAKKFSFNLSTGTATLSSTVAGLDANALAIAYDPDRKLLSAMIDDNTTNNAGHALQFYEISNPSAPVVVSNFNFVPVGDGTNVLNPNFAGMVDTDGTRIVALDTQNGIVAARLRQLQLAVILTQPESRTNNVGTTATFSVSATGNDLAYRWRKNGVDLDDGGPVSGATSPTLTIAGVALSDAGTYDVAISSADGTVTSTGAALVVVDLPTITSQPVNQTNSVGSTAVFSVSVSGTGPFTFQWQKDGFDLSDNENVSGSATDTLILAYVTGEDAGAYSVAVSNSAGSVASEAATLSITEPPTIISHPASRTNNIATTATFTVIATGDQPLLYQWQKDGVNLSNGLRVSGATTATLSITGLVGSDAGEYRVVVSNDAGTETSAEAVLTVKTDIKIPTIKLISPGSGQRLQEHLHVTNYQARIHGTAADDVSVAEVAYSLNDGPFIPANGTTNWHAFVALRPGTNSVVVKSVDGAGNTSLLLRRNFYYVVPSLLTVNVVGNGQVKNLNGNVLEVGKGYKVTALVGAGTNFVFTNWLHVADGVTNSHGTALLSFIMRSNLTLTANFITNPFVRAAGTYNGLFYDKNGIEQESSGFFTLRVTSKLGFSGKMVVDGNPVGFSSKFAVGGAAATNVWRAKIGKSNLGLTLALDFTNWSHRITGTLSDGTNWTADLLGDRVIWTTNQTAAAFTNRYTMLLPAFNDAAFTPVGHGYGLFGVDLRGKIGFSGYAADGHRLGQGIAISQNGEWPFYVPLYITKKTNVFNGKPVPYVQYKGALLGWITLATNTPAGKTNLAPQGTLSWIKNGWTNNIYPDGFAGSVVVKGSRHIPPAKGTRVLNLTNGTVTAADGNLSSAFSQDFVLGTNNVCALTAPVVNKFQLTLAAKTGLMSGGFLHPGNTNRTTKFYGAILQDYNYGRGHFVGTNQAGSITLDGN